MVQDCLNCGSPLSESDHFCSRCGQKADTHRLTWKHFGHEVFHAVTHADASVLHLFKNLLVRPGVVAREYLDGKRKKYFNPFTWFLLSAGTMVLLDGLFGEALQMPEPDPAVLERMGSEAARANYIALVRRSGQLAHFMATHGNLFAMAAVPILALVYWLVYRRRGFNYVEFLTATLLFESVTNLVFPFVFQAIRWVNGGALFPHAALTLQFVQISYLAFALAGLLQLKSLAARIGAIGVAAVSVYLWTLLSLSAFSWYVLQNRQFYRMTLQLFRNM